MYQPRTPGYRKRDAAMRWALPDRVFFACGACHILAHAFLTRWGRPNMEALWIKPAEGFTGNHIVVATENWVFDYHGYSARPVYFDHVARRARQRWPGWTFDLISLPPDVLVSEAKSKRYPGLWLREPKQFLHDATPRAEAYLDRFPAPLEPPGAIGYAPLPHSDRGREAPMSAERPQASPGVKLQYLIRRRDGVSREELIAHWFANHMPNVIQRNVASRADGRPFARRYVASLFDAEGDGPPAWDGVAQLWYDDAPPSPARPHGVEPADSFQEKAAPYTPWATREWVFVDGALPLAPSKVSPPFPASRSGFLKQVSLVPPKPGVDFQGLCDHWLDVHGPNVRETMVKVGGFRYAVSLSTDPAAPYAGMAELYFPDRAAQAAFWEALPLDGFQDWVDGPSTLRYRCGTEMVGVD